MIRHRFQRHVDAAVRQILPPGEELETTVGVTARVVPTREYSAVLFDARQVIALTSRRVLLLNYFGVVGRHVELVAACRREKAGATLTKVLGVRLLRVDFRGAAPTCRYRVYFRFAKRADALARALEPQSSTLEVFKEAPGDSLHEG